MQPLSIHAWLRWDAVERLLPQGPRNVLEIGAGLGSIGAMLGARFDYVGIEPDPESQAEAWRRTQGKVRPERIEDHEGVYDLVCAFEVLEHIEDDAAALALWRRHSRRWLLLSVPMNPGRFGAADEHAGHFRRYTIRSLESTLREAGWRPHGFRSYGFPAGYALEAARNRLVARRSTPDTMAGRTEASGRWLQPPSSVGWLTWAMAIPLRGMQRPFAARELGTGLVALAERA